MKGLSDTIDIISVQYLLALIAFLLVFILFKQYFKPTTKK